MSRNSAPALLLPLAAILAVAFPFAFTYRQTVPQQQQGPKPSRYLFRGLSSSAENPKPSEIHDANRILAEFFGQDFRQAVAIVNRAPFNYEVHHMIVTVPDPIDSRLPYLFDRFLASIQRAAEADHFVLDRFDLPWLEEFQRARTPKTNTTPSDSAPSSNPPLTEPAAVHSYDKQPGLLLFRDAYSAAGPRLLLVFVVGEIPNGGIHKAAFISALDQIAQLRKTLDKPEAQEQLTIPILGPSFSGSAESVDFALQSWLAAWHLAHDSRPDIRIVSGSATAIPTESTKADNGRWYFNVPCELGTAEFESTVVPDAVALSGFLDFLDARRLPPGWRPLTVALLTEANTAYGVALANAIKQIKKSVPPSAVGPDSSKPLGKKNMDNRKTQAGLPCQPTPQDIQPPPVPSSVQTVSLPFPLHISRLRSESEKTRRAREQNSQQVTTNTDSRYLPVPLDEEGDVTKDSIPAASDLDTSSAELILANLLSTISHEQFDYVGIAATDVRDTIFLAREIREHSPSSVIFSLNADLIYSHPEANPNTRGMLIITPYPLLTLNQRWVDPFDQHPNRLQFPDQNSEGVYNAMLLLLRKSLHDSVPLLEYGVPFAASGEHSPGPPIWITTVGRLGFWPIAVVSPTGDEGYTHHEEISAASQHDSTSPKQWASAITLQNSTQDSTSINEERPPDPQQQSQSAPVKADSLNPSDDSKPSDVDRGLVPHSAIFVYVCWSLLCLAPSGVFLWRYARRRLPKVARFAKTLDLSSLNLFREPVLARNQGECHAYFLVGGIASVAAYIVAVTACAITAFPDRGLLFSIGMALMLAVMLFTLAACWTLARDTFSLSRDKRTQSSSGTLAYPVLFVAISVPALAIWLALDWLVLHIPAHHDLPRSANHIVAGFRALNLLSGVSPLPPLFLIALAASAWAASAVRRVHLAESLPWKHPCAIAGQSDCPNDTNKNALFNSASSSFKGFQTLELEIQDLLRCPTLHLPGDRQAISFVIFLAIVIAGVYIFYARLVVAIEPPSFYFLFGFCFLLVYLSIVFNILRLFFLWLSLRKVLHALGRHPIRPAFARFHRSFPNLPQISLAAAPSLLTALNFSIQQAVALLRSVKFLRPGRSSLVCASTEAKPHIDDAERSYREAVDAEASKKHSESLMAQLAAQRFLAQASCIVEKSLEQVWSSDLASPIPDPAVEEKREKLVEEAEEFLVGRTVLFLSHIFPQMTNLAGLSLASLLLLLLAVSSYPFQPHQLIVIFIWLLIFSFSGVALHMSVQMKRDTVLSNLNGSKPGEISWDREFITRVLLYVVIPILGFLGVQFPDALAQIFSFLSPGAAGHG